MEDKVEKTSNQSSEKKRNFFLNEDRLRDFGETMKCTNICITGIPEEERTENLFQEIMTENFPNLVKKKDTQVQRVPNKMDLKRPKPRYILINMVKFK